MSDYTPTTAPYINPALPTMIRGLYRTDLREKSIQNMLDLAADLVQELIELRAKRAEWEAEQGETEWEYALMADGDDEPWSNYYESREHLAGQCGGLAWRDDEHLVRRRKSPWLPVPDTGAES